MTAQDGDNVKALMFYNRLRNTYCHFLLGIIITETNFDLMLSSPDNECFQIIIFLFLGLAQYIYPVYSKTELQSITLTRSNIMARTYVSGAHLGLTS